MDAWEAALCLFEVESFRIADFCEYDGAKSDGCEAIVFIEFYTCRQIAIKFEKDRVSISGIHILPTSFEYADPDFIDKLMHYIMQQLGALVQQYEMP